MLDSQPSLPVPTYPPKSSLPVPYLPTQVLLGAVNLELCYEREAVEEEGGGELHYSEQSAIPSDSGISRHVRFSCPRHLVDPSCFQSLGLDR